MERKGRKRCRNGKFRNEGGKPIWSVGTHPDINNQSITLPLNSSLFTTITIHNQFATPPLQTPTQDPPTTLTRSKEEREREELLPIEEEGMGQVRLV